MGFIVVLIAQSTNSLRFIESPGEFFLPEPAVPENLENSRGTTAEPIRRTETAANGKGDRRG